MIQKTGKDNPLAGRLAFVTGAGRTNGRISAGILAAAGAKVILCDIDRVDLDVTARRIREAGGEVEIFLLNSESEDLDPSLVLGNIDPGVKINILVNALSVQFAIKSIQGINDRLAQDAVILNVLKEPGIQNGGALQTSLAELTRSTKVQYASRGIQVFGLSMNSDLVYPFENPKMIPLDELTRLTIGMKDLIIYLCSPEAKEINGRVFELKRANYQGE